MYQSKSIVFLFVITCLLSPFDMHAQSKNTQSETFKVWGNCGMCEKTIEGAMKIKGVSKADWNKETKMMVVAYNPKEISLSDIHKRIAGVGYDTDLEKANDDIYNNLHGCCKYERKDH